MARISRKNQSRKRTRKGGGFTLPRTAPNPDALFTMLLSAHQFFDSNFKKAGIKISSKKLMKNLATALENTFDSKVIKNHKPEYNVAADALAAAYCSFIAGDKKNSREMISLAFKSPDCAVLMDSLAALNTDAEGLVSPEDFLNSDFDVNAAVSLDEGKPELPAADLGGTPMSTADDEDNLDAVKDKTGNNETADEDHGAENSSMQDRVIAAKKLKRKLKKTVKSLSDTDEFADDDGDLLSIFNSNPSATMTTGKPRNTVTMPDAGFGDIPSTMKVGDVGLPETIEPFEWSGDLNRVSLLSNSELKKLVKSNPKIVAIANKIAGLGDKRSRALAQKFLNKIFDDAA